MPRESECMCCRAVHALIQDLEDWVPGEISFAPNTYDLMGASVDDLSTQNTAVFALATRAGDAPLGSWCHH